MELPTSRTLGDAPGGAPNPIPAPPDGLSGVARRQNGTVATSEAAAPPAREAA